MGGGEGTGGALDIDMGSAPPLETSSGSAPGCSDVSAHADVAIQVDLEIPDDGDRLHRCAADSYRSGRDLVLTTSR